MKLLLKIFSTLLLVSAIFIFTQSAVNADLGYSIQPLDDSGNPTNVLDENTAKAKITFTGLTNTITGACIAWSDNKCVNHVNITPDANGQASIVVCGDVNNAYTSFLDNRVTVPGLKTSCGSGDYFHAHDYDFSIDSAGVEVHVFKAAFAVARFIPNITISPAKPKPTDQ